jgi:hypothetical protein
VINSDIEEVMRSAVLYDVPDGQSQCTIRSGCALDRLAQKQNVKGDLMDVGESIGLSYSESIGVMDGWDEAKGYTPLYRTGKSLMTENGEWAATRWKEVRYVRIVIDETEYWAGVELGQRLCAYAGETAAV